MAKAKTEASEDQSKEITQKQADKLIADLMDKDDHLTMASEVTSTYNRVMFPSPSLNYIYSGFLKGRIHRLHGPESGGKSSLAIYMAACCQKAEKNPAKQYVFYFDFERTFDKDFAAKIGLDVSKTIICTDACVEDQAIKFFKALPVLCCAIFDSDAAASSRSEFEDEIGKPSFGGLAKIIGAFCRRANNLISEYQVPLIMISQERANTQPMGYLPSITGGYALRYFASTRCRVQRAGDITDKDDVVGIDIKIKCYKNKTGIVGRSKTLHFYFKDGFHVDDDYFEAMFDSGIFHASSKKDPKTGTEKDGYFTNDQFDVQFYGRKKCIDWLNENPDKYELLKQQVNERMTHASYVASDDVDHSVMSDEDDEAETTPVIESTTESLAQQALEGDIE